MGITDEASKAAGGVIDALKTQPLVLALVVMNFALIGFVYYQNASFMTQRSQNVALWVDMQKEVQKLLAQCIIPAPEQRRSMMFDWKRDILDAKPADVKPIPSPSEKE